MTVSLARPPVRPRRVAAALACLAASLAHADDSPGGATALPAINVTAAHDSPQHLTDTLSTGALGTRRQLDTPFSTTIVTSEELEARQPYKLGDVFANDASVSDNSGAYSAWASYMTVRGMQLDWQNGYKIDGLPFVTYGITMPYEQLDRVELLKARRISVRLRDARRRRQLRDEAAGRRLRAQRRRRLPEHQRVDRARRSRPALRAERHVRRAAERDARGRQDVQRRQHPPRQRLARAAGEPDAGPVGDVRRAVPDRRTTGQTPSIFTGSYPGGALPATISGGTTNLGGKDQYLNTNLQLYTAGLQYQLAPDWQLDVAYSYSKATRRRNESTLYLQDAADNYTDSRYVGMEDHRFSQWRAMVEGKVRTGVQPPDRARRVVAEAGE